MRLLPIIVAFGVVGATIASSGETQVPDAQISPQSLQWQKAGEAALAAGQFQAADDALQQRRVVLAAPVHLPVAYDEFCAH